MGRVYKPTYTTKTGERITVSHWYAEWGGADGKQHRAKVSKIKAEALAYLVKMEAAEQKRRLGIVPEPGLHPDRARPLQELLSEYTGLLAARGVHSVYLANVRDYLTRTLEACGWSTWATVTPDSLVMFLGERREKHDNAAATLNGYLRTARGFTRWVADRLGEPDPLRRVKRFDESDRRRSKRILTDAELAALLEAAKRGKPRGKSKLTGLDRSMLYRVAAYTGLRASELATLTPSHFQLDSSPPVVTVEAKDSKGKRLEPIPIPAQVVEALRPWLANKRRGSPVWPGNWAAAKHQTDWLAVDLARAGIAEFDSAGRRATFHGLRRGYITRVIRAGAKIHEVKRLARHRDLKTTLEYYTDDVLSDLGTIVDRLA